MSETIPLKAGAAHCALCFSVLADRLGVSSSSNALGGVPGGDALVALFVTWKKRNVDDGEWDLRGCIGNLSPIKLQGGLERYALISSLEDRRFSPVIAKELPLLRCTVSLLVNFEDNKSAFDWQIGTHGIIIDFTSGGRSYSGTYLPEVMPEQGWDHETAIRSLVRKSGYRGTVDAKLLSSISLTRYQSSKYYMTFQEWAGGEE